MHFNIPAGRIQVDETNATAAFCALLLGIITTAFDARCQSTYPVEIAVNRGHDSAVLRSAISPDGKHFVTAGSGTIRVWKLDSMRLLRVVGSADNATALQFTQDSNVVMAGFTNGEIVFFDIRNTSRVKVLRQANWLRRRQGNSRSAMI